MKEINYAIWQEGEVFVSQCMNTNVSSFGDNMEEAKKNLIEALELYFEDSESEYIPINNLIFGTEHINA